MFFSSAYSGETETLFVPLDFAELLPEAKLGKLASKIAHCMKQILFDTSNVEQKSGLDLCNNLPKVVFYAKNTTN